MYQLAVTNPSHWTNHQFTIIIIVIKAVIIIITFITKQFFNIITIAIMPVRWQPLPQRPPQGNSSSLYNLHQPPRQTVLAVKPHEATVWSF